MQLILSIDDIGIKKNMSAVEEANENENEVKNPLLEKILSYSTSSIAENSEDKLDEVVQDSPNPDIERVTNGNATNEESSSTDIVDSSEENSRIVLNEATSIENDNHVKQVFEKEDNCSEDIAKEIETENEVNSPREKKLDESGEEEREIICDINNDTDVCVESETQDKSNIEKSEAILNKDESQLEDFETVINKNNVDENTENFSLINTDVNEEKDLIKDSEDNGNEDLKDTVDSENKNNSITNGPTESIGEEIIDIADEKDSCDSAEINEQLENHLLANEPLDTDSCDISMETGTESILNNDIEDPEISNKITVVDDAVEPCNEAEDKSNHSLNEAHENTQNIDVQSNPNSVENTDSSNKLMNFKLSNTLDILSDDEENITTKPESPKAEIESEANDKQCINIEDDDDIMLIDDESNTKENKVIANDVEKTNSDCKEIENVIKDQVEKKQDDKEETIKSLQSDDPDLEDSTKDSEKNILSPKPDEKTIEKGPLLPSTSLKSFKKNLAEMTREELEDFCILKIVESVFDKSNLGEIKSQMKLMAQNIEEYKAKAKILTKQNRDLQVVLKSVQEEQKKNSSAIIPLKITRSVGMQVLMTDKSARKRQSLPSQGNANVINQNTTNLNKSQNKNQVQSSPNTRTAKPQQPIPVPRLIPAVTVGTKSVPSLSPLTVNNSGKSPTVNNIPNGLKSTSPVAKPEKRSHSKMQQNSSVTVDLTDDEPPAKVNNRNFNSSVRCVPPQSLLAPQRSPLPQSLNSPKKVYIPISGPQGQTIRPGQTIMLKSVSAQGPRPRGSSNNIKNQNNPGSIRAARVAQRHPAPLPEFMKQYQPPNWKALPPAPELKLAKVENGIVISWKIDGYREENHEEIASYQLFAYQETASPPNTSLWKKIGDVKALPLPMACTLTQFMSGYKYYFAVRAVDIRSRFGPFSLPGSILLLK